ncbi:hypothetical protein Gpo141_00014972, partial [Globisporangium polare]
MWWAPWKLSVQKKHTTQVGDKVPAFLVNPPEPQSYPLVRDQLAHPALHGAHSQRGHGLVSDDAIPFSWLQSAFSLFAYVWLLTNFVRTSFAIRQMNSYNTVEPNVFVNFGPYA